MNKTNIKRAKVLGLSLLTAMMLSACAQSPSDSSNEEKETDYSTYAMVTVDGVKCRISANMQISSDGIKWYDLEDGTDICVSTATGELLVYDKDSTVMEEVFEEVEDRTGEKILTID